ncbi:BTB/POZ and MATH domain-containing protein 2 [Sorghum bicolor]|uniref:BTB/POZ and MATH domain-containing protein 2 n=1 Tax=Sorghum bicolor TaxID=4558 RepID=UPI000B425A7B|nr:BTB/POZ and MATH domain-containing protein 2 [Sorghum bicolor]|eukprot:XP_002444068.2 BTB/POZ and MATH domain-containing protein 2 [Sorghum bicolor]
MNLVTGSATVAYYGLYIYHPIGGYPHVVLPPSTIESNVFAAGPHYWSARFVCQTYGGHPSLSMSLQLCSRGVSVKASWELSVIDPRCRSLLPTKLYGTPPLYFEESVNMSWDLDYVFLSDQCFWYVDGDSGRLVLLITVTVFPDDDDPETTTIGKQIDDVPPSDMLDQFGEIFETREGADVTFSVDGELFPAHKIVLAMRSRVFKAQLYGEMKESVAGAAQPIEISAMTADTFRALLRYIYTDASPASSIVDQQDEEEDGSHGNTTKVWELLTAADRYSVERLKLICERILCKRIDVDNVADTLGLADRHHCGTLKDACIDFMTTSSRMDQSAAQQGLEWMKINHGH